MLSSQNLKDMYIYVQKWICIRHILMLYKILHGIEF